MPLNASALPQLRRRSSPGALAALLVPLLSIAFPGCSDLFEYHAYDARVTGETGINKKNIGLIEERLHARDTFRFAVISDTQGWYDETEEFVAHVNKYGQDIDFVVHAGDLTDYGITDEFLWQRDILEKLDVPYVAIIGNHDCLGNGEKVFQRVFGEMNFTFTAGGVLFVALQTNIFEYDYDNPVPNFQFMDDVLARPDLPERTIVLMHVRPYADDFNDNAAMAFEQYVRAFPGTMFCVNGHEHRFQEDDIFSDGIMYYGQTCVQHHAYLVFTITPEGYTREVRHF